jgi:DNA helicase-2/ATP-dependent DNA helicase PcrA
MDLSSLNDKQLEAVTAPLGPVLVLAGAGSGKTRALAFRIAYLCEQKLINPENILALTFTNKAAKEMQERVKRILEPRNNAENNAEQRGRNAVNPRPSASASAVFSVSHMGTFHSICARILRAEIQRLGYSKSFTIYDSDDQSKIIREIIGDLNIDKRFSPSLFKAYISSAKNILQTPGEFSIGLEADMHNMAQSVYSRYQDYLFKQNGVDFDDLLMLTVKIYQNFPEVLKKYQELFKYILVDEYQDTNHAQYVLLYALAQNHQNLFVVGDDAQSIYGFRGSNIRNILNFEEDFPQAKVIKLEQNYRSTKNILATAQKVIEMNTEQKSKILWTENEEGSKIAVHELEDETAEAKMVAKSIIDISTGNTEEEPEYEAMEEEQSFSILDHFLKKSKKNARSSLSSLSFLPQLPKQHDSLNQFAVLFRTHAQSRALEEVFIESGIPYQIVGGLKFYERKEIKDVLAYLRLTVNYRDLVSLKRVVNEPARGIGEKTYQVIRGLILEESLHIASGVDASDLTNFRSKLKEVKLGPKVGQAVDSFFDLIDRLSSLNPEEDLSGLMRLTVKRTNFEQWLRDGTEQGEARWENVEELFTVAEKFKGLPWRKGLERFLEEVALITEIDEHDENKDRVTFMTLHSAKGLEFDTVFLVGLEEGILPHSRSLLNPSELSEEVRLAYVGLTRARKKLFLTYATRRRAFGSLQYNQPSRILRVLPKELVVHKGRTRYDNEDEGITVEELDF